MRGLFGRSALAAERFLSRIAVDSFGRDAHDEGFTRSGERRISDHATALAAERFLRRIAVDSLGRDAHSDGSTRSVERRIPDI